MDLEKMAKQFLKGNKKRYKDDKYKRHYRDDHYRRYDDDDRYRRHDDDDHRYRRSGYGRSSGARGLLMTIASAVMNYLRGRRYR